VACGGGGDDPEPTPAPTETPAGPGTGSPEAALATWVQTTLGKQFVADCSKAVVATDNGKVCSNARGERENMRAYTLGLVASEVSHWAIVQNQGGVWAVVSSQTITPDNAGVPGIPWPLRTGVDVVVAGTGNGLNVRTGPGLNAAAVDRIDDGTVIRLSAGPAPADNLTWWQVEGRSGWVVADYLRYPDAAANTPPPPAATQPPAAQPSATRVP
jgi:hypothetical protein